MGNSSASLPDYSCRDPNISRDTVTPEYWESASISDDYHANATAIGVIMSLFLLIGLPANIMIIISIIYKKLYKEPTHILLLNLAISDLLVCVLVMPFTLVAGYAGEYIFGATDHSRCQACQSGLIYIVLTVFAVKVLALISLDRFIFIKYPLRYETIVTPPRTVAVVAIAWVISLVEAIPPFFGFGEIEYAYTFSTCSVSLEGDSITYGVFLVAVAFVSIAVIIVTNIWVICIVRKQIRKVYRTRRSFGNKEELKRYNQGLRKEIRKKKSKKQVALIRAFGVILAGNFFSWTPTYIQIVLLLSLDGNLIPLGYYTFVWLTFVMHSVLHPLIEGCFIPEIRQTLESAFKFLLCCKKRRDKVFEMTEMSTEASMIIDEKKTGCCDVCRLAFSGSDSFNNTST